MKSMLKDVIGHGERYQALAFICPGCIGRGGGTGLHMLPVNTTTQSPSWEWNGDLEAPTLSPSILTKWESPKETFICHGYLRAGVFEFLDDCTHEFAGEKVPLQELPGWFLGWGDDDD